MQRELQLQLEKDADAAAASAKLTELRKAALEGDADLPRAARFISSAYGLIEEHLEQVKAQVNRGNGAKYKSWLRALPTDVAAVIALREVIAMCTSASHERPVLVQDLSINVGKLWETEVRVREAEKVNPVYMQRIHEQVKSNCTTSQSHLRRLYNVAYERVMKEEAASDLKKSDLVQIGKFGVNACLEAGIIEQHRGTSRNGIIVYFTLSEETLEFLTQYSLKDVGLVVDKMFGGMVCPPDDWTTVADGGYCSHRRKFVYPLLNLRKGRASERARMHDEFTAEKMPSVFACANYLQAQAFAVHAPAFAAIHRVWQAGGGVLGVPTKTGPVKPKSPVPEDWVRDSGTPEEQEAFSEWKRQAVLYYEKLREWRGKVREIGGFLRATQQYNGPIWFPVYADSRGRWYYRGTPNPQGSDLAKSVLHFSERKPLGNEGLFWLKVHIANSAGFDKERFEDRARWTEQHWDVIERALDEPENHADVWGTDAPWCMFSAAWELREAYRSGNPQGYASGIPVHMDATCSGLQHFSAILRDPIGGMYVNLYDDVGCGPKQDIYARVAGNALEAIKRDSEGGDEAVAQIASWWLTVGIPRALAKKPVMTYVYGATLRGTARHIEQYVADEMPGAEWPDPQQSFLYAQYAARKLFQGIAATVPAADNAMRWLREVAKQQPRGTRMEWRTPTGFLVQHDYQSYEETLVWLRSCGMTQTMVRNYTDGTNPLQMQNAISPNFVHALDGSHLTMTALRMKAGGLSMVGIHDSFGTHACDVAMMHRHIREAFVELYANRNILGEFLWDVHGIGEPPMRGTLDIHSVIDSEFFFC